VGPFSKVQREKQVRDANGNTTYGTVSEALQTPAQVAGSINRDDVIVVGLACLYIFIVKVRLRVQGRRQLGPFSFGRFGSVER